jgi:hypothetical protein
MGNFTKNKDSNLQRRINYEKETVIAAKPPSSRGIMRATKMLYFNPIPFMLDNGA